MNLYIYMASRESWSEVDDACGSQTGTIKKETHTNTKILNAVTMLRMCEIHNMTVPNAG